MIMISRHSIVFHENEDHEERKSDIDCHPNQFQHNRSSGLSDERSIGGHENMKVLNISTIAGTIHNYEVERLK